MKVFGISIVTFIIVIVAYYAGSKGWLSKLTGGMA